MEKNDIPQAKLAEHYFITCHTVGKTPSAVRGYREKLGRFIYWCEDTCLDALSVELARDYIAYLSPPPKYENHPDCSLMPTKSVGFKRVRKGRRNPRDPGPEDS